MMALISASELAKTPYATSPDKLYYFYGRDIGNMEGFTKKLLSKLIPEGEGALGSFKFDAKDMDIGQFADAVTSLPLFSKRVCAHITGFNADKINKEDTDALKLILSDIPETTTVIINADGENVFKSKKALTEKNKKFADMCAKTGTVCDFAYRRAGDMGKYIVSCLKDEGVSISSYDAQYLANQCGSDTALVDNEIEKLIAYADGKPVTRAMIDLLVTPKLESDGFALAINILRGNAQFVFHRIDELAAQRYEAIEILGTISYSIMDIYRAKLARSSGKTVADIMKDFSYPPFKKFAVENAFSDCGRIGLQRIRRVIGVLSDTDLLLKTKGLAKGGDILALEECAAKCMAIKD